MIRLVGVGTDIVDIKRFRALRYPRRVAAFFLSAAEWEQLYVEGKDMAPTLAGRFAAKEAVIKSIPERVGPLDFEILKEGPKPVVKWVSKGSPYALALSISHEEQYATATSICFIN